MLYEITYILKPELTNEEQDSVNALVADHIKNLEGTVTTTDRTFSAKRGGTDENNLRKFAYPIKHYRQGYYYTSTFELSPSNLKSLESTLSREASILRFLIVKDFIDLSQLPVEDKGEEKVQEVVEEKDK